ncbi:MAG: ATP-binding protein [Bacteroidia bacterium]
MFTQKRLKILMLEDSPSDAGLIQHRLKQEKIDFTAKVIETGEQLIDALKNYDPDIILSDHSLPQFNSFEALTICREYNYKKPFILVTGTVSEEFAAHCIKEGADDYLLKDKLTRLPSAIFNALNKKEALRENEEAQQNLKEQNIFMNLLLESLPIAHYLAEARDDFPMTYVSNSVYSFTGYHPEQFVRNSSFWMDNIHPDDLSQVQHNLPDLMSSGEYSNEYRWKIADGAYRWFYDKAKLVKGPEGRSYVSGAVIDITQRKEAEEKLIVKNKELNTFIYRSTHDLRGPLMSIIGITNLAKKEQDLPQLQSYTMMIDEATKKLDTILLSLITTMSIKDAKANFKEIDIEELLAAVLKRIDTIDGYKRMQFITDIRKKKLYSDELILGSVLQNIIENAIKYHNKHEDPWISIRIVEEEKKVIIEITDNGPGMKEEVQEKVFDMFYRGNLGSKGSGLGLYIVRNGVEKLGGTIYLNSVEEIGTTFIISLPVEPDKGN